MVVVEETKNKVDKEVNLVLVVLVLVEVKQVQLYQVEEELILKLVQVVAEDIMVAVVHNTQVLHNQELCLEVEEVHLIMDTHKSLVVQLKKEVMIQVEE
tara:strand:- start:4 stop:300 length:297 start_codon:yes stop_codon:yes gene_type:complete